MTKRPVRVTGSWGSRFVVIVPVKSLDMAKSRLDVGILRPVFALAFIADVATALMRSSSVQAVYILTSDDRLRDLLPTGIEFLGDTGTGLNAELLEAFGTVRVFHPTAPVAVVFADLPALTSEAFDDAARAALLTTDSSFVPDADCKGTTMLFTRTRFTGMYFGDRSSRRFEQSGMKRLDAHRGLRRDVDTVRNLKDASTIGLSQWTRLAAETAKRLDSVHERNSKR